MSNKMAGWVTRFSGMIDAVSSLFHISRGDCLSCRQASDLNRDQLGLCKSCYRNIPWIEEVQCSVCGRYEACPDCHRRKETYFEFSRSAVQYDAAMKELLARYKYRGDERLQTVMGEMLVHAFQQIEASVQAGGRALTRDFVGRQTKKQTSVGKKYGVGQVITYVPVSQKRYAERGFNQAEQMAIVLSGSVGVPVIPLLQRVRHTDKQSFKSRSDRIDDLRGVFELDESGMNTCTDMLQECEALHIYIVDDVYTTGSTMNECAKVLKGRLNVKCYGVTWAR